MRIFSAVLLTAMLLPFVPTSANAADHEMCIVYSNDAVRKAQEAANLRCGFSGPVWSTNPSGHMRWCLNANEDSVKHEKKARESSLRRCQVCANYANSASQDGKVNQELQCGFGGPRWQVSSMEHFRWCMGLNLDPTWPNSPTWNERDIRAAELARCKARKTSPGEASTANDPNAGHTLGKRRRGFSGTWDTQTIPGGSFAVTFTQQGNSVTGKFNNGSLAGTLDGTTGLNFTVIFQSTVKGTGRISLTQGGKAFDGRFTLEADPGTVRMWTGTRR